MSSLGEPIRVDISESEVSGLVASKDSDSGLRTTFFFDIFVTFLKNTYFEPASLSPFGQFLGGSSVQLQHLAQKGPSASTATVSSFAQPLQWCGSLQTSLWLLDYRQSPLQNNDTFT